MCKLLYVETSTIICSVGISDGNRLIALREDKQGQNHAALTAVFIQEVVEESGIPLSAIDAVVVSKGPGSYTGLRIGVSSAKGLCYGLQKPLIAVSPLQAMADASAQKHPGDQVLFCPMIDARRMEVFNGLFNHQNQMVRDIQAEVLTPESFSGLLEQHPIVFSGDGAIKCQTLFTPHPNIIFDLDTLPSAKHMVGIALQKFHTQAFEDMAYFEPFYLKDFVAGTPKVKGLYS